MGATVRLSSSLRAARPEATLARARARARSLGVTRVTDITRLDRVGLPVFASIRPGAVEGSLCVNAGKGLLPIEAEIGATMEAIELALAEPGASPVRVLSRTARHVLDGRKRPEAILDLCPRIGTRVRLDAPMDVVRAEEVRTGRAAFVPAELVFLPYRPHARFRPIFGTSSNGLASGNTRDEALLHALAELVERDVRSFEAVRDTSRPVDLDHLSPAPRALVDSVRAAGLELHVRTAKNEIGLPYFFAVIHDPDVCAPHLLNGGFGCHTHRDVAFVRAVTEAAQSRLSFIHGGRDDLVETHDHYAGWSASKKRAFVQAVVRRAAAGEPIAMDAIDDRSREAGTIGRALDVVLDALAARGMERVYRVAFTEIEEDLQVVRVIVPGLELWNESLPRLGRRLRDHARAR